VFAFILNDRGEINSIENGSTGDAAYSLSGNSFGPTGRRIASRLLNACLVEYSKRL
jgi:hypothetical protein